LDHSAHNKIVSFIWSIADDCLRDVYVRGKYRDVILPMFVLRRLDCLLEPSKDAVMEEVKFQRDDAGFTDLDSEGLKQASGYVFYNTSPWTLKKLVETAANNRQILEANFKAYLAVSAKTSRRSSISSSCALRSFTWLKKMSCLRSLKNSLLLTSTSPRTKRGTRMDANYLN